MKFHLKKNNILYEIPLNIREISFMKQYILYEIPLNIREISFMKQYILYEIPWKINFMKKIEFSWNQKFIKI